GNSLQAAFDNTPVGTVLRLRGQVDDFLNLGTVSGGGDVHGEHVVAGWQPVAGNNEDAAAVPIGYRGQVELEECGVGGVAQEFLDGPVFVIVQSVWRGREELAQ